jgi:HSP20 family molecular chaperone IbpA
MQRLKEQMNSIFADTFDSFGDWFDRSSLASSTDVRENKDDYVVRAYVPDSKTSKINATVENNALHIIAAGQQKENSATQSERYEQIISLPGPVQRDKMQIERKEDFFVITLPKATAAIAATASKASPSVSPMSGFAGLDQLVIDRMTRMQGRMQQIFQDAFPNDTTSSFNLLQFGSAVNVDEQNDRYIVHFYLPDKDLKNVDVNLKNGELRLTASETEKDQERGMRSVQSGRYEQLITLPGPVKESGMKVDRKNGTIVVTLPKA